MRDARAKCAGHLPRILIVTDRFEYYRRAVRQSWGPTCVHVESSKIIRRGRVVRLRNQLVLGLPWQLESARERLGEPRRISTALIERLNLFIRRSLACLQRKTTSQVRSRGRLSQAIDLLQCCYDFVRLHGWLRAGGKLRTPAQAAGLVTRPLSLREVFLSFRPWARVPWIVNPKIRADWGRLCVSNS
jgi:IS1 family transposase